MREDYCPKCGWGPLEQGEVAHGDKVFRWQYCDDSDCAWQSEITRYQLVRFKGGTAYQIDATIVQPQLALANVMRRRLQLPEEPTDYGPAVHLPVGSEISASCPGCGAAIRPCQRACNDLSGYEVFWRCEGCGFQDDARKIPAPGIFRHSPDYRSICWNAKRFELTSKEIPVVKALHLAFIAGTPDVHQHELSDKFGLSERIRDCFRRGNRELWNTLIIRGTRRGTLRLAL